MSLFKYPRISEGAPTNHYAINARFIKHLLGKFRGVYIPISNNRDFKTRSISKFFKPIPASIPFIFLLTSTSMYTQSFYTNTLQHQRNFLYTNSLVIPTKSGFNSNRTIGNGINYNARHTLH